uniref:Beta-defensin n=1 Tax=Globodera pallida TaxID=36090 RepID=A0A183BLY0_GLOPA
MHPIIFCLALAFIVGIKGKEVLFLEVLDVGNCRKAVKVYCPCGWARCVRRMGSSCTHELRECCPDWSIIIEFIVSYRTLILRH